MESKLVQALHLTYHPVAIVWTDKKPENALHFKKKTWGCVMWMFASAAKGRTVVFDRKTYGCVGGGVGLGFGNQYRIFPGSEECFCYFLSKGNEHFEFGKNIAKKIEKYAGNEFVKNFLRGERFMKSPEQVKKFLEQLPIVDIPKTYVVFKPISEVTDGDKPVVVSFITNPHQLSALITLSYYEIGNLYNVVVPKGAGCHQIGIFAYREAESKNPRAVVGITDLFARKILRDKLGEDIMTFTVPFTLFQEMEENVDGSFLQEEIWEALSGMTTQKP